MNRILLLSIAFFICAYTNSYSQDEVPEDSIWLTGAGLGADLTQLIHINPKVGAGDNKLGIGGVFNLYADYKKGRWIWNNKGALQFGIQRLGSGVPISDPDSDRSQPFQKTVDEIYLQSALGFQHDPQSKWYYAAELAFKSQLTPTYPGSFLSAAEEGDMPNAKFLAPATINFSPGMKYVANEHFNLLIAPSAIKLIMVLDDDIASIPGDPSSELGLHGNPWRSPTDFDNTAFQFGAAFSASYTNKFAGEKLILSSNLLLFTDYLDDPFVHTDVDWRNELSYQIWKGLQLTFGLNVFYAHEVLVQITDYDAPGGLKRDPVTGDPLLGRRVNITQSLYLKYNHVF